MNHLLNNFRNIRETGKWLLNVGDLRGIGKTEALVELAKEVDKSNSDTLNSLGIRNTLYPIIVQPNSGMIDHCKTKIGDNPNIKVISQHSLERELRGYPRKSVVLLIDEGCSELSLKILLNDSGIDSRIAFKAGWKYSY